MEESGKKSLDELIFDENLDLTKPEVFYTLSKIFEEGRGVDRHIGLTSFFLRVAKALENESGVVAEKEEPFVVPSVDDEPALEVGFDENALMIDDDIDFDIDAYIPEQYDDEYSIEELLGNAPEKDEEYEIENLLEGAIEENTSEELPQEEIVEENNIEEVKEDSNDADDVVLFDLSGLDNAHNVALEENQKGLNLAEARIILNHKDDYSLDSVLEAREYVAENGSALDCYSQAIEMIQENHYEEGIRWLLDIENRSDCSEELLTKTYAILCVSDETGKYTEKALQLAWKNRDMHDAQKFLNYFYTHDCAPEILASLKKEDIQFIYESLNHKKQDGDGWLNKLVSLRNKDALLLKEELNQKAVSKTERKVEDVDDILEQLEGLKKLID